MAEGLLGCAPTYEEQLRLFADVLAFVAKSPKLKAIQVDNYHLHITQTMDGKSIILDARLLTDVLLRSDTNGSEFIQVNFSNGNKILITDALIGFKPATPKGVDLTRLPRVVTTPDVLNVFEAIQEALHSMDSSPHEMAVLKKVYNAVIAGGEAVGFDLATERSWLARVPITPVRFSS